MEQDDDTSYTKSDDTEARTKTMLLVDLINYIHIQETRPFEQVWNNLRKAFDDSGLTSKVSLLRELITTDLESCENVENYIN